MERQHGLKVKVAAEEKLPPSDEDLRVLLFQTVRELLFNVVKHANVKTAAVEISHSDGVVRIDVNDDGKGFDAGDKNSDGRNNQGLKRIDQRLQLLGGRTEIASAPGKGTRVTLYSPLKAREGR